MRDQLHDLEKTEAERRTADQGRGSAMVARDRPAPGPHAPPDIRAPVDRAAFAARWLAEQRDAAPDQGFPDGGPAPDADPGAMARQRDTAMANAPPAERRPGRAPQRER